LLYLLFFCSGLSGLIYQVVWVREFGNAFGNTVYSASVVVAVFMLGLGAGSYLVGRWADRRYSTRPDSLLRAYGFVELAIAGLGLAIALVLPHLSAISALTSSYSRDAAGWYVPSTASYLARGAIATLLVAPITVLMGGTLTLLVRHQVRGNLEVAGARIAVLYGVNTAGAALGCLLTDFALVPAAGLQGAQAMAAILNLGVAIAALWLARREGAAPRIRRAAEAP
jgi:spermidine synthase